MCALNLKQGVARNQPITGSRWTIIAHVLTDLFFVSLTGVAVFYFRFVPDWLSGFVRGEIPTPGHTVVREYPAFLFLYGALIVLFFHGQDLYRFVRTRAALDEILAVVRAMTLATLVLIAFIYLSGAKTVSRLVVGSAVLLNTATLIAWRFWWRRMIELRLADGHGARNVLIIGAGKIGQGLAHYLEKNKQLGFVVKGFLDDSHAAMPGVLGRTEDLPRVARANFVDEVLITIPSAHQVVRNVVSEARRSRLEVKLVPEMYDGLVSLATLEHLGDFPMLALHREPIPEFGLLVKRTMDIILSMLALLFLLPLMAVVIVVVKLDHPGPVLYLAERVGRKGRRFVCYKFRTMVVNAEEGKEQLRQRNERQGPFFKMADDPRITRVGKFLRKYSLDEVPQLWNVFKGDMSLVGPRPHPVDDFEQYKLEDLRRLDVTPGITGLWQIYARQNPSFEENMAFDLEYIGNWNVWLDLKILLKTIPAVLRGSGS